ncbi:AraC family transcriptional regulator [Paenibacillus sp. R14(2021)]|uniref:helix-turn-helix transcriptional regulator n=1 Tax=Paenibacillus sp. R14(2021) TaxID=2859228 RepID=UPI001C61394E|nr:AraC family transcriptional regulator [Paenibacillus sp. R14(2021)]
MIIVQVPPLPHFLTGGRDVYAAGDQHVERQMIGVFDLIVVSQGTLFIGEAGIDAEVGAGQALILRPDLHHYPTKPCEAETTFYWIHFQLTSLWSDRSEPGPIHLSPQPNADHAHVRDFGQQHTLRLPRLMTLPDPAAVYAEIEGLLSLISKSDLASSWKRQAIFHNLLFRMYGDVHSGRMDSAVVKLAERTASYLRANYRQALTNEQLRSALNYHPIYITRCMRAVFGCTPNEYVNEYRMGQAKLQLLTTDRPIAEIAADAGFEDPAYFTRRFGRYARMSPTAYRNQFITGDRRELE